MAKSRKGQVEETKSSVHINHNLNSNIDKKKIIIGLICIAAAIIADLISRNFIYGYYYGLTRIFTIIPIIVASCVCGIPYGFVVSIFFVFYYVVIAVPINIQWLMPVLYAAISGIIMYIKPFRDRKSTHTIVAIVIDIAAACVVVIASRILNIIVRNL